MQLQLTLENNVMRVGAVLLSVSLLLSCFLAQVQLVVEFTLRT